MGGPNMRGQVIPQCLVTDRLTIKFQLTRKSCLIFKFYSDTALRTCETSKHAAHMN